MSRIYICWPKIYFSRTYRCSEHTCSEHPPGPKALKAHWNPSKGRWNLEFKELQQLNLQSNQCNLHWSTTKALLMMLILIAWESFINFGRFFVCSWLYQHFWLWLGCEKIENKHFNNEKWMSTIKIHSQLNLWYKKYDIYPNKNFYKLICKTCII